MPTVDHKMHVIMLMKEAVSRGAPSEALSLFPTEAAPSGDPNFVDWKAVEDRLTAWLNQPPSAQHTGRAPGDAVTSVDETRGVQITEHK